MTEVVQPATSAPAAAPAPAAPVVEVPVVEKPAEAPKPERTFSQSELDAAIEKRLSKERRKRTEIETRLKVTEELALRKPAEPEKPKPQESAEPKRDQFDSYEEFVEARAEWRADKAVDKRFKEREQKETETRTRTEHQKASEAFKSKVSEQAKGIEDFQDVIDEATAEENHPFSRIGAEVIASADNPAKVLYHLAKNREEAERIASLNMVSQAREIWKLEAKLASEPPQKKPSSAPAPIAPVGGKATAADAMPDAGKNPKEWIAWRNRQVAAKRFKGT